MLATVFSNHISPDADSKCRVFVQPIFVALDGRRTRAAKVLGCIPGVAAMLATEKKNGLTYIFHALHDMYLLRLVVAFCPESVRGLTERQFTPLHAAVTWCLREESMIVVSLLLSVDPSTAALRDDEGNTALHLIVAGHWKDPCLSMARAVMQAYPSATTIPDRLGRTPLQLAEELEAIEGRSLQPLIALLRAS